MQTSSELQFKKMTETPIPKLVLGLGIPTTISMLVTNIYNMADTYFVGKLGTSASGAVGIVFGFMALIQALGFMFGQGQEVLFPEHWVRKMRKPQMYMLRPAFFVLL